MIFNYGWTLGSIFIVLDLYLFPNFTQSKYLTPAHLAGPPW